MIASAECMRVYVVLDLDPCWSSFLSVIRVALEQKQQAEELKCKQALESMAVTCAP